MSESDNLSRRQLLAGAAVFSAATLAPGVILYANAASTNPVSDKARWGILIDANQCDAQCDGCVKACADEFGVTSFGRPTTDPQWIRKLTVSDPASGVTRSFPVMCQHCKHPPCVDVCPTGASFIRADGIVLVDRHLCIGCRYCMMACPYKARSFVHEDIKDQKPYAPRGKGTVEACTMCVHRIDDGRKPACVEACSTTGHAAMLFGDLNDPNSEIAKRVAAVTTSQIRADLRTDPAIRYQGI
jgi:molybdopterin-containing oxidoreductase family iron-sulfur binding subunit